MFATFAISDAGIANKNNFDQWFTEIAISISFDKKFCNCDQTKRYACNEYEPYYKNLCAAIDKATTANMDIDSARLA